MLVSLLLLAAAQTTAAPAPSPTAAPKPGSAADPNRQVCVTDETIGSRLNTHRTCHSAAEWDQIHRDAANNLDQRTAGPGPH